MSNGGRGVGWLENQNLFQGHVSFYSIYFIHICLSSRYICRHFLSQLERSGTYNLQSMMLKTAVHSVCLRVGYAHVNMHVIVNDEMRA